MSFNPIAPDPSNAMAHMMPPINAERVNKPFGDDGLMNISTAVAVAGISARPFGTPTTTPAAVVVPPDPTCQDLALVSDHRFIDFTGGVSDPMRIAQQFGCIAKLGKNGCGLEQQLEAALKAVTPTTSPDVVFSRNTKGHGDAGNRGFLREDSILAVILVTDEEDCSIPDSSSELFNPSQGSNLNFTCGPATRNSCTRPLAMWRVSRRLSLRPTVTTASSLRASSASRSISVRSRRRSAAASI